jgi:hypothetical protein
MNATTADSLFQQRCLQRAQFRDLASRFIR